MLKRLVTSCLLGLGLMFTLGILFNPPIQANPPPGKPVATPDVSLLPFATGLDEPTDISHAGDDRLFVAEQAGRIRIVEADGTVLSTPFLDIADRVRSVRSEQGLLGLAFHPNYDTNGYFYVNYTNTNSDTHISRFQVFSDTPNLTDPDSEVVLLTIEQDFANHNGGDLNFGPDGYLYIGLGDGGGGGDPNNRAQTLASLLGKMLRIDVDSATPYAIPPDNPFVDDSEARGEIWAFGLRNPWRFSFDRLTDDLYIADVGQGAWEEVDLQPASSPGGENYGWSCYEGNNILKPDRCDTAATYTFPIHVYEHTQGNCSVTGGYVYRGSQYPVLWGHYLFADYCSGKLWSLTPAGQGGWQVTFLNDIPGNPSTFGENLAGELFVAGHSNGIIYHLVENTPSNMVKIFLPIIFKSP